MLLALLLSAAARAGCSLDLLHDAIGATELAFSAADAGAFADAIGQVREDVGCADQPFGPSDAAAVHRAEALAAFLDHDLPSVVARYAAARRIEPGWQLPSSLALADHPLRRAFDDALAIPPPALTPIPPPAEGWVQVDGVRADEVPVDAPFVLQRFDRTGAVAWSGQIAAGAGLPTWQVAVPDPEPVLVPVARTHRGRAPLLIGGALLAVGGALSGYESLHQRAVFWDARTPSTDLDLARARTNGWAVASWSCGVGVAGTVGAAVLVSAW